MNTSKKRRCILFTALLLAMVLCAFYNVRMGILLHELSMMDQVFSLTKSSWVAASWLGRLVLSILETPMQVTDFIRCFLNSFHPEQVWFLVLAILFIFSKKDNETTVLMKVTATSLILLELIMLALCGWLVFRTYLSMTTLKAIETFQLCGGVMLTFSVLQILIACITGPLVWLRHTLDSSIKSDQ